MKLLLITHYFGEEKHIASVRTTKLAKHLSLAGHEVTVVTAAASTDAFYAEDIRPVCRILRTNEDTGAAPLPASESRLKRALRPLLAYPAVQTLIGPLHLRRLLREGRHFAATVSRLLSDERLAGFDAMISSYGPLDVLLAALEIKKRHPALRWVCDFRDPPVNPLSSRYEQRILSRLEREACTACSAITTVSGGMKELFSTRFDPAKIHVIPNGYDPDDLQGIDTAPRADGRLRILLMGSVYSGLSRADALLNALNDLALRGLIDPAKVEIAYAGGNFERLKLKAAPAVEAMIKDHGRLSRKACLALESKSDVLTVLSWNTEKSQGIMTGKFYEYLLFDRPMLALVSGDLPGSEIKQLILQYGLGFAYEEACHEQDYEPLKAFLLSTYAACTQGEGVRGNRPAAAMRFGWPALSQAFEDLAGGKSGESCHG